MTFSQNTLSAAFSPCPNDIFLFRSFIKKEQGFELLPNVTLSDIDTLNAMACEQAFPLLKISAAHYPSVMKNYRMLPVGAAIGFSCGPLLVAKANSSLSAIKSVAVPGIETTAAALVRMFFPSMELLTIPYDKILDAIENDLVHAGVIIHESRFSYDQNSLKVVEDLGLKWEKQTSLPLPLGCLVLSREVSDSEQLSIIKLLQKSLSRSLCEENEDALSLALTYAKEKDPSVIKKFSQTYISQDTMLLSPIGEKAFTRLWDSVHAASKKN
ncbi:MqnA/MqnD/SBP family protein [Chlamydiifrater phoenicopteri]|uniref:MqnA/MqnD/SBP family protein n=1 Tax=Chlamydiifrater phoenicopteri TaxID=2681469 RepID=UPI001BCDB836|nr:MqnA/MqnD/SBP family protein [Chlamydiifrater phoenicopteri]